MTEFALGDSVKMRKTHPCGSDVFTVIRVGADIKIKCQKCGRIIMLDRPTFVRRMKAVLAKESKDE